MQVKRQGSPIAPSKGRWPSTRTRSRPPSVTSAEAIPAMDGETREGALLGFLRSVLPTRWGIGTGKVVAHTGEDSPQLDMIIFDALNTPMITADAERRTIT